MSQFDEEECLFSLDVYQGNVVEHGPPGLGIQIVWKPTLVELNKLSVSRGFQKILSISLTMSSSPPTPSEYVTLVSGDGFEFIIPRSTACVSGTIRRMLEPASQYNAAS